MSDPHKDECADCGKRMYTFAKKKPFVCKACYVKKLKSGEILK